MGNLIACITDDAECSLSWPPGNKPELYRVAGRSGATIRISEALDSPILSTLAAGTLLQVDMVKGRRCRIIDPVQGWGSTSTEKGYVIIERVATDLPKYKVLFQDGIVVRSEADAEKGEIVRLIPCGETIEGTGDTVFVGNTERIRIRDGWVSMTQPPFEEGKTNIVLLQKLS